MRNVQHYAFIVVFVAGLAGSVVGLRGPGSGSARMPPAPLASAVVVSSPAQHSGALIPDLAVSPPQTVELGELSGAAGSIKTSPGGWGVNGELAAPSTLIPGPAGRPVAARSGSSGVVTAQEFLVALSASPWPPETHQDALRVALCEAGVDTDADGVTDGVQVDAAGDGGLALGPLQVRVDVHRDVAAQVDLQSLEGGLLGAWLVWVRAGRSWRPWSCAR